MNRHSIKKKTTTKMKTNIKRMMKKRMKMRRREILTPIYNKIKKKRIRVRVNFKNI